MFFRYIELFQETNYFTMRKSIVLIFSRDNLLINYVIEFYVNLGTILNWWFRTSQNFTKELEKKFRSNRDNNHQTESVWKDNLFIYTNYKFKKYY